MRSEPPHSDGFTLIEILVVVAILGLSMALIAYSKPFGGVALTDRAAVTSILAGLREARSIAIVKQQPVALVVEVTNKTYRLTALPETVTSLPSRLDISVLTAAAGITGSETAAIKFLPDGSSTGGEIRLIDGQWRSLITVNWLTGRISSDRDL